MNAETSFESGLENLRQILVEERDCIRELEMDRLQEILEKKKDLLPLLEDQADAPSHLMEIARDIRFENRRNAYLLKTSLNWIRDLMEMFGRSQQPSAYGRYGNQVVLQAGGGLLSGKV
jgi:flagellar biosynthesis/type III secretory pathway chaperone